MTNSPFLERVKPICFPFFLLLLFLYTEKYYLYGQKAAFSIVFAVSHPLEKKRLN